MANPSHSDQTIALHLGSVFESVDWLIPAYLQRGFLSRLALVIKQAESQDKLNVFRSIISLVYNREYLAVFFPERYTKISYVKEFKNHIDESFKAYFSGYKHVAITAMIPVIEGIIRKIASEEGRNVGQGTTGLIREFNTLVDNEENSPHRNEERVVMFTMLRNFMRDRFLRNTDRYDGLNQFNRHGILHGVFDDYGEDLNFYRLITILDLLCMMIGIKFGGASFFAPENTPESIKLAAHHETLIPRDLPEAWLLPVSVMRLFME